MNRAFSVYLDLVRFTAACLVYLYHSNQRLLVTDVAPASHYGHSSVVVFFVLSGFVIAYVSDTKEKDWVSYCASRLSRIFSVALPAVGLTLALDAVGRNLHPALYDYPFDQFAVRVGSSLLMLNEIWFVSITSFSNVPYWSICYEAWYYAAFAVATFAPRRVAWLLLVAIALMLGPKIVLLAPIWWAGVALYRWKAVCEVSQTTSWAMVVLSCAGIVAFHVAGVESMASGLIESWFGAKARKELTFSQSFLADYLLGALVCLNFAGVRGVAPTFERVAALAERPIRFAAGFTLTLYLTHQPLLLFWAAVVRGDPSGPGPWLLVTLLTGVSVMLVGYFTESRRHVLKRRLEKCLLWLERALQARRYSA